MRQPRESGALGSAMMSNSGPITGTGTCAADNSDFQDTLGFSQGYLGCPVITWIVHPLTFIAIRDDFRPLRWRELGRLHGRVYRSNVGWVLALSESYIHCS
jgi:hypothetical protein